MLISVLVLIASRYRFPNKQVGSLPVVGFLPSCEIRKFA